MSRWWTRKLWTDGMRLACLSLEVEKDTQQQVETMSSQEQVKKLKLNFFQVQTCGLRGFYLTIGHREYKNDTLNKSSAQPITFTAILLSPQKHPRGERASIPSRNLWAASRRYRQQHHRATQENCVLHFIK